MIETIFIFMLSEIVLGGGGRTFSIGAVSLRMLLFAVGVIASLFAMLRSTQPRNGLGTAGLLLWAFVASLLPGLLVDANNGTPLQTIGPAIQPLLFWLLAPFFALALQERRMVVKSANIIIYGGCAVAVITSLLMVGLSTGFVDFATLYIWSDRTEELYFRGTENFFYKGHFFVSVSLIFCLVLRPRWWRTLSLLLLLSLVLSLTRSLFLATGVALVLSFVSQKRQFAFILSACAGAVVFFFYGQVVLDSLFDPTRAESYQTRSRDFAYFLAAFDYNTLILGEGTGALLGGRAQIENSYLWVVWRFGIAGLAYTLLPLFLCLYYFRKMPSESEDRGIASAFFFGAVMLYIVTAINPFINNSIGITYLLVAVFSLRRMSGHAYAPQGFSRTHQ